jgi:hypothetical protein
VGSLATFKTTYLASTVVPTGPRERLAGVVYALEQRVAEGAAVATARANVTNARALRDIHKAQRLSSPYQGALASDFLAIDAA